MGSNKGEWFLNKYCKGKKLKEQSTQLARTQKRGLQRKRSIHKMRNMMAMLDQAEQVEREKVCSPKKEIIQEI